MNIRATYNLPGNHLYVAGYVRNLNNSLIVGAMSRTPPFGTLVTYQPPRTYGLEAGFKF